ncbi:P27 family phage terminase small subunit [Sporosarcina sp. FA9]|uniref:P27 family phage terminase small subunit n=1 Tax=Sporosarcina sp. FA9 TaxID=3413030 RepID=UPI003F65B461
MAKKKHDALRKRIEKDLMDQLDEKEITGNQYTDLVQDYLSLWDLKNSLVDDIENVGIKIPGMHGPKSNPSINDLHKTNDRMLKVLDALGLKASPVEPNKKGKAYSTNDLM